MNINFVDYGGDKYEAMSVAIIDGATVCEDGLHCGECKFLEPHDVVTSLDAKCTAIGCDLMWHDYWIAECEPDESKGATK